MVVLEGSSAIKPAADLGIMAIPAGSRYASMQPLADNQKEGGLRRLNLGLAQSV